MLKKFTLAFVISFLKNPTVFDSASKDPYWTMTGNYLKNHLGDKFDFDWYGYFGF